MDAGAGEAGAAKDGGAWKDPTPEPPLPPYVPDPVPDAPEAAERGPEIPGAAPVLDAGVSSGCSAGPGHPEGAGAWAAMAIALAGVIGRRRRGR
jgi:uncharacterized protein (TIGR03382 family)